MKTIRHIDCNHHRNVDSAEHETPEFSFDEPECKILPVRNSHKCFGCSPVNPHGLGMRFSTNEKSLFSWLTVPDHLSGWKNLVHGGVISTILDEVMGWSAIYLLKSLVLTKSMTVDFLKPVFVGKELKAEGRVRRANSEREALMDGFLFNRQGDLCARAKGTFALFTPEAAIRMGLMDEQVIKDFETLIHSSRSTVNR